MTELSFVIPAHNEERELGATLHAIHEAARPLGLAYEVVVADDASTDSTRAIAEASGARVVNHERRQIAATRNLGAKASTGRWLIFVDADTRVTPGAVREAVEALRVGAVGGGCTMRFDGEIPLWGRVLLPVFNFAFRRKRLTGGAFLFCTRHALDLVGGWEESVFASEELILAGELKNHGEFVIVRTPVVTSGRKLRTHSGWEVTGLLLKALFMRRRLVTDRKHLDLWYAPRRPDPNHPDARPGDSRP